MTLPGTRLVERNVEQCMTPFRYRSRVRRFGVLILLLLILSACGGSSAQSVARAGTEQTSTVEPAATDDDTPTSNDNADGQDNDSETSITNADQLAHDIEFFSGRDLSVVGVAPGSVEVGAPFEVVFTPTTLDQSRDVEIELTLPAGVSSTGAGDCAAGSGVDCLPVASLAGG